MAFDFTSFQATLSTHPGVYRMLGSEGDVLYVGKAKNLKKRVTSYFRGQGLSLKNTALVEKIAAIETTITASETEALLLEQNLIKEIKPPFNILLRDDKSYPYIFLSSEQQYPRMAFHRGAKRKKGQYFGPYPSSNAVRESLNLIQKVFRIRQCEDSFFSNRSRPCLQYQINRCTAPCVGAIEPEQYQEDMERAVKLLQGKNRELMEELVMKMEQTSEAMHYEQAALYRDQITALRRVQEQQFVDNEEGDVDAIAVAQQGHYCCVHLVRIRSGRVLGSKSFYPKLKSGADPEEIIEQFVAQFYLSGLGKTDIPGTIAVTHTFADKKWLEKALFEISGTKTSIASQVRGHKAKWLEMASVNAEQNLAAYVTDKDHTLKRFEALQAALNLDDMPQRLECFDISHTMGEATVASCVVFDSNGPLKSDYRRFNIDNITPGDDYAAMEQALTRRYTRLKKGEGKIPDILFIDGGKGQLNKAREVLEELQVSGVTLIGVSKGPDRRAGLETLYLNNGQETINLHNDSSALHLIQHIRDESHRFAIAGHRGKRGKKRRQSALEGIEGVGPKRRKALLNHFGGMQEIQRASAADIARVPGISRGQADVIYAALHE